jgi:ankyrin repeat protein
MGALFKAPEKSMEILCDKYPDAARTKDKEGYTPLHLACENGAEAGVVKILLNAFPDAVWAKSQYDMTPLHFACSQNADAAVIRTLLMDGDPRVCQLTDMLGHTPLHMAIMGLAPYEVIELLVASSPETVLAKTQKGELPLEIAQRKRAPSEVLELLEKMIERLVAEDD